MYVQDANIYRYEPNNHDSEGLPQTIQEYLNHQWKRSRFFLLSKISLVSIFFVGLAFNSSINIMSGTREVKCFVDTVQDFALPVTLYLGDHGNVLDWYIIICSAMIDICFLALFIKWIWFGKSLRMFFVIFFFYMSRAVTQKLFATTFPEHYIFRDPGFFSVGVPYFKTNDFFFSGHIGITTIFFSEFKYGKATFMKWFAFGTILMNSSMLLLTQGHFSIDLVVGVLVGHWLYTLGFWLQDILKGNGGNKFASLVLSKKGSIITSEDVNPYPHLVDKENSA